MLKYDSAKSLRPTKDHCGQHYWFHLQAKCSLLEQTNQKNHFQTDRQRGGEPCKMWERDHVNKEGILERPNNEQGVPRCKAQLNLFFKMCCHSVSELCLTLQSHGLQHARLPCPSLSPGVCSNSCPLSWWHHPTMSSSAAPFSFNLQSFPASGSFSNESALSIRWPKYWSFRFSISPSGEYSKLISFRIDWFDLLVVQESSPNTTIWKHQFFSTQPCLWSNLHVHTWLLA